MYLFKPKTPAAAGSTAGADPAAQTSAETSSPFGAALPSGGPQASSAAEWALGELLIRLCNRGRGLQSEPPDETAD